MSDFVLSAGVSILILCIEWIYYLVILCLFLWRRDKFPIKQRLPFVVVIELILFALGGTKSLLQSVITAPDSPLVIDCRIHIIYIFIFEYLPILVFAYRVSWIILKRFNTNRLYSQCHTKRSHQSIIPPYAPQTYYQTALNFIVNNIGVFPFCIAVVVPGALIGLVEIILQTLNPDTGGVNFYTMDCFYKGYRSANAVKIAVLLPLLAFLFPNFVKLDDKIKLGQECRAISALLFCYCGWLIALGIPDGYRALFVDSRVSNYVIAIVINPIEISIQGLYPLYLSWQQERAQKAQKELQAKEADRLMSTMTNKTNDTEDSRKGLLANQEYRSKASVSKPSLREELLNTLESTKGRELFLKFLQKEFAIENLLFYEACVEFRTRFETAGFSRDYALFQATEICNTYVKVGAVDQVNLSDNARREVLTAINSPEPKIDSSLFEKTEGEIFSLIAKDSFSRFKVSKEYKDFWRETL
jgi:hypothetical protein